MSKLTLRDAKIEDAEELVGIYSHYVLNTAVSFEYDVPSVEEFQGRIVSISAKYPYIVALRDGKIVGYAYASTFKPRPAYDYSVETTIYVDKNERRTGVGRALYDELEVRLKARGIKNMYACIAMPDVEDVTLTFDSPKFHEKMGYTLIGTFHKCGNKFGRWYDMCWMEKFIGEH